MFSKTKDVINEKNEHQHIVDKAKLPETLLRNEKYILETCEQMNRDLRLINSYHFYKELKEDMYELGIYKKQFCYICIMYD